MNRSHLYVLLFHFILLSFASIIFNDTIAKLTNFDGFTTNLLSKFLNLAFDVLDG